jgi:hypothetical protein
MNEVKKSIQDQNKNSKIWTKDLAKKRFWEKNKQKS